MVSDCLISFNEIRHDLGPPCFSNAHSHVPVFFLFLSCLILYVFLTLPSSGFVFSLLHFLPCQFRFLTNKYLKSMKLELPYYK